MDVLNDHVKPVEFRGKIVLVGTADPLVHDIWPSPRGWIPGTEVVAHGIDSILNGVAIQHDFPEILMDLLMVALFSLGATWWLDRVRPWMILPWTAAMLAVLIIGETIAFARWRMWLTMCTPALTLMMSCLWIAQKRLAIVSRRPQ
jgi:CHASE2 domain-containing sensor protein